MFKNPDGSIHRKRVAVAGFTMLTLLLSILIIGVISAMMTPVFTCEIQKGKMAAAMADLHYGAGVVEAFEVEHGRFPNNLDEAYVGNPVPDTLIYCVDGGDPDAGHGNEICSFFDNDNPSGNNNHGGIPELGFLLMTTPDVAPCKDFSFAWTFCCGRDPVKVTTNEDSDMPGHPGNPQSNK